MSIEISVVICTHNPREDYFARTLDGLRLQTADLATWELIVVDNQSSVPLRERLSFDWHPNARIVEETKLGLTPARLRGIREAKGALLILVDDDNVLDPDYISVASRIGNERPFLGAWSGQCRPSFEEPPPDWTRRYWGNLVIREFHEDLWSNLPRLPATMPCGAGLCIRHEVAEYYLQMIESGKRSFQFDRTGNSLVSGGDNDLAACACDLGLGVGIVTALKLQHLIPPQRLTADYLARLAEGITFSSVLLDATRGLPVRERTKARQMVDLVRLALLPQPHRSIQNAVLRGHDRAIKQVCEINASQGRMRQSQTTESV